ncbi:cytochrome d ubiquinol oxidase subunit II [Oscillospiraceae bacterium CM]|nr:cytochrome d ubiquinol oxidase subunit II [Oscillospiraceae bacterium CM]
MNLNILWFLLIAVLYCGYFFLDGMDLGVGMLFPVLGKKDKDKALMLRAIGPTWGASEVWLLTAGGATFAAFPGWYASMFSGFYPALFLLLLGLIARGIGVEYWGKAATAAGKKLASVCITVGSLLPPLLLACALANIVQGIPIDASQNYTGTLFTLFTPFTLAAALGSVAFFLYHGAVFTDLKAKGDITGTMPVIKATGLAAIVLAAAAAVFALLQTDVFTKPVAAVAAVAGIVLLIVSYLVTIKKPTRLSMILNALVIACGIGTVFGGLFPNVMISSTDPANSLTIYNTASTPYTLTIMLTVTISVLPIVLLYTIWSHWSFRKLRDDKSSENQGDNGEREEAVY